MYIYLRMQVVIGDKNKLEKIANDRQTKKTNQH